MFLASYAFSLKYIYKTSKIFDRHCESKYGRRSARFIQHILLFTGRKISAIVPPPSAGRYLRP